MLPADDPILNEHRWPFLSLLKHCGLRTASELDGTWFQSSREASISSRRIDAHLGEAQEDIGSRPDHPRVPVHRMRSGCRRILAACLYDSTTSSLTQIGR